MKKFYEDAEITVTKFEFEEIMSYPGSSEWTPPNVSHTENT